MAPDCGGAVSAAAGFAAAARPTSVWGALWREADADHREAVKKGATRRIRKVAAHLSDDHACAERPIEDICGNRRADEAAGRAAREHAFNDVAVAAVERAWATAIEVARGIGKMLAAYPSAREWCGELEGRRSRAPDAGRRSRHVWSCRLPSFQNLRHANATTAVLK